jgi:pantothenate kinase type III
MQGALLRETGGIRTAAALLRSEGADAGVFGRDTETCIRLGAQRAIAGLVAGSMQALNGPGAPAGRGTVLVLTGGDAPALLKALALPADHRPLLVLEGLAARYAQGSP